MTNIVPTRKEKSRRCGGRGKTVPSRKVKKKRIVRGREERLKVNLFTRSMAGCAKEGSVIIVS